MTADEPQPLEFVVEHGDPRQRADRLVVALLTRAGHQTTRAEVQRWMAEDRVRIDGTPAQRAKAVPVGAIVTVRPAPPPLSAASPDPSVPFTVVYEDEHLLVVDKPAGVVVHPARGHWEGTLVHGLLAHRAAQDGRPPTDPPEPNPPAWPADPRDPEGHLRPGIVHRLDKDTSGLLVVAKDAPTREALKDRFARHDIERSYTALVIGRASRASYDTPFGRHPRSRIRYTSLLPEDRRGVRRAVTHVQLLKQWPLGACVRCRLETGRTHQIRVHLAEQGATPVLADALYGVRPQGDALRDIAQELGRQALHATTLGFVHPATGRDMRWQSALPDDFQQAMDALARC